MTGKRQAEMKARLIDSLRASMQESAWLTYKLRTLAANGDRETFEMHCLSRLGKLAEETEGDPGVLQRALDALWKELGGDPRSG